MALNIVLHEPEIPSNTGNIGRTCAAVGAKLHLIEPLGFHLSERNLKRAGMDYWDRLDVTRYSSYDDFLKRNPGVEQTLYFATTKGRVLYSDMQYEPDCFLMFGKESGGIPEEILKKHPDRCVRIPMLDGERSLNLSNSVAVLLFEALRQNRFPGLEMTGELHHSRWEDLTGEG